MKGLLPVLAGDFFVVEYWANYIYFSTIFRTKIKEALFRMFCGKKYARRVCREGFTLVELLIVIVVIGVLSAMMMLSSTEAVASARATKIINDLHEWKMAALSWYMDNVDRVTEKGQIRNVDTSALATGSTTDGNFAESVKPSEIAKYLGSFTIKQEYEGSKGLGKYNLEDSSGATWSTDHYNTKDGKYVWLIGYQFPNGKEDKRVQEKLAARAASAGLVYKRAYPLPTYDNPSSNPQRVWIEVIDFSK